MADKIDVVSPFCVSCTLPHCPDRGRGCPDWREWYINWWNRNIAARNSKKSKDCECKEGKNDG